MGGGTLVFPSPGGVVGGTLVLLHAQGRASGLDSMGKLSLRPSLEAGCHTALKLELATCVATQHKIITF